MIVNLSIDLQNNIKSLIDILDPIRNEFDIHEVYLFGSYAKRCVTKKSDIDILVLLGSNNKDREQLRKVRWQVEDIIESNFNQCEVDVKLYTKDDFTKYSKVPFSFEQIVSEYMIKLI